MSEKKTLAVVGMGPLLGMSVARRFGKEGLRVAMVSRNQSKLNGYVAELAALGIEAAAFPADVCNRSQLAAALDRIKTDFAPVDVLEYSPLAQMFNLHSVLDIDADDTQPFIDQQLFGAMIAVRRVLPDMLRKGEGALLLTTGCSSIIPMPSHANGALAVCALRHYAYMLNAALADKGVYAGTISIGAFIEPDYLADLYWDMYQKRDRVEEVFGNLRLVAAYEHFVMRGFAQFYPPKFIKAPPEPRNEKERETLLLALYQMRSTAPLLGVDEARETERVETLARRYGGDPNLPFFGVST